MTAVDGMQEVVCRRCATVVLVRKSSPAHTSIQWASDDTCTELAAHRAAGRHPGLVPTCEALRESIAEEVRSGRLQVADA